MIVRSSLLVLLGCCFVGAVCAAGDSDKLDISFDKPVQIPEGVLPPGKYKIQLEDHLADRAIVRITQDGGADHYLLVVPSNSLATKNKGLIFFPATEGQEILHGWECGSCKRPLEFVYPKDEAVKLTATTGKPIMAYDPSYDKLPANLSLEDRKVVTLWLLKPMTVTADGRGKGLTAAKYSKPKIMATAEPLPTKMPKTASTAFAELGGGTLALAGAGLFFLRRKTSPILLRGGS